MASELPGKNGEPQEMNTVKEEEDDQHMETSHNPGAEEKRPHEPHSVTVYWEGQETKMNCKDTQTVEALLMTSEQFRRFANKNQDKVLIIVRDGKPIVSHFPCSLVNKKPLTVKYITDKPSESTNTKIESPSGEFQIFHIRTKGEAGVVKIMKHATIERDYKEITVYGYKGETVNEALRRDGRFQEKVFTNCALSNLNGGETTEMSSQVGDIDGGPFKILRIKAAPSESECRITRQQSAKTELVNEDKPKEVPEQRIEMIPESKETLSQLSSQFQDLVDEMITTQKGPQLTSVQDLFHVEYGKNLQTCLEVKMMKTLMGFSDSVCQVRINEIPEGSGFLLFDKYVLTNGHVVKKNYDDVKRKHRESITVHFLFESLNTKRADPGVEVEEVTGFKYGRDESGQMQDWALLKLCDDQKLPKALLTDCTSFPQNGGICIIGHPDLGVKKIDPCLTVPVEDRGEIVQRHHNENPGHIKKNRGHYSGGPGTVQMISQRFFENVAQSVAKKGQTLTYESCFYFGSSGSPVFDEYCKVVAMHSGGYTYQNTQSELKSVIEFGYPLSIIIENILVQLVKRRRFDVFKDILACRDGREIRMDTLKEMVGERNLSIFEKAAFSREVRDDRVLKKLFDFICQRDEPMEC